MLQNRSSSAESAHANSESSVSGHCLDSSGKSIEKIKCFANYDSLLFQNRSSSTESAHANTEARVSGHCLDSSGKSMKVVSKKSKIFSIRNKIGLTIFLRDWDDFAAKTEFGIVVEYFCGIKVGLRIFFSEEKREEKLDLE